MAASPNACRKEYTRNVGGATLAMEGQPTGKEHAMSDDLKATRATFLPWAYRTRYGAESSSAAKAIFARALRIVASLGLFYAAFRLGLPDNAIWSVILILLAILILIPLIRQRRGLWSGDCPHCSKQIYVRPHPPAFDCPICAKRVAIERGKFVPV